MKLLALLSTVIASVISPAQADEVGGVTDQTVRVGQSVPETGFAAPNGLAILHGTQAYFNRINAQGGIHGRKLEIKHYDDAYNPENTARNAEKLVNEDHVLALLSVYSDASS